MNASICSEVRRIVRLPALSQTQNSRRQNVGDFFDALLAGHDARIDRTHRFSMLVCMGLLTETDCELSTD